MINKVKQNLAKRAYVERNPEKVAESKRLYTKNNLEKVKETKRRYKARNKEKLAEKKRLYYELNPEKLRQLSIRRYVAIILKPEILIRDGFSCVLCNGNKQLTCHHIVPVQYCIEDSEILSKDNLITLCKACHKVSHLGCFNKIDLGLAEKFKQYITTKKEV